MGALSLSLLLQAGSVLTGAEARSALVLVGVQDCHLEAGTSSGAAGSLAVPSSHILPVINKIRAERECLFDVVVRTQDLHPASHISFASTHGLAPWAHLGSKGGLPVMCIKPNAGSSGSAACCPTQHLNPSAVDCSMQLCPPEGWSWTSHDAKGFIADNPACAQCASNPESCYTDVQAVWPKHCLAEGGDAAFPLGLAKRRADLVVQSGGNAYSDAHSAFMDHLQATLLARGVDTLYVAGIGTNLGVKATVRDALSGKAANFTVKVISDASAAFAESSSASQLHSDALAWMRGEGATIVTSSELFALGCAPSSAGLDLAVIYRVAVEAVSKLYDPTWGPFFFMGLAISAATMIV